MVARAARIIIGVATFFDAFDALAIAFVLPVLVPAWKLNGPQIGFLISAGYLGQLGGALFFGWIAERYGRITAMVWSILIFAVMSLACAFALGLSVAGRARASSRVSVSAARFRWRRPISASWRAPRAAAVSSCSTNLIFPSASSPTGLVGAWSCRASAGSGCSSSARCRPLSPCSCSGCCRNRRAGWRRGDASKRRKRRWRWIERETEKSTGQPLPPPQPVIHSGPLAASWSDLFGPLYLRRTLVVWVIWFATYFFNYGLVVWLPTIYSTVFKLPLQQSLQYGLITQAVGFAAP